MFFVLDGRVMSHLVYIIIYMYNVIFFIRVFRLNNVCCVLDGRVMSHLVYIIRYIMLHFLLGDSALIMFFVLDGRAMSHL